MSRGPESTAEETHCSASSGAGAMVHVLPVSGIPAEDFLCVPEPDEDERLSSGLDGDETSHKQVSVEGARTSIHRVFSD